MLRAEATTEIARTPEEVFAFATDVERLPEWMTGLIDANQLTDGAVQKGTRFEHVVQFLGKRFTAGFETTEYEEGRRIAFRTTSGPIDMETTVTYEESPGGTRVHQIVTGNPRGFFKVAEPVLVRLVERQLKGSLENLKDLLEAEAPTSAGG
jgi:uncharacterized protein YndB with AHSA1/START domain